MEKESKDKDKRIYVREEAHERYKRWAINNGHKMLDALGHLLDEVEAGRNRKDKQH